MELIVAERKLRSIAYNVPDFGISAVNYGAKVSCLIVFAWQIPLFTCGFIENTKHTLFSTIAPNRQLSKNRFVKLEDFAKQQVNTLFHIKSTTSYGAKKPKMGGLMSAGSRNRLG